MLMSLMSNIDQCGRKVCTVETKPAFGTVLVNSLFKYLVTKQWLEQVFLLLSLASMWNCTDYSAAATGSLMFEVQGMLPCFTAIWRVIKHTLKYLDESNMSLLGVKSVQPNTTALLCFSHENYHLRHDLMTSSTTNTVVKSHDIWINLHHTY